MILADHIVQPHVEVPSALPTGSACIRTDACEVLRRSHLLPADLSAQIASRANEFVVAATLVLARKYSNSVAFRLTIRQNGSNAEINSEMPAELALEQHRDAVAADLARIGQEQKAGTGLGLCYALDGCMGESASDLTISSATTPDGVTLHADLHWHVYSVEFVERLLGHLENLVRLSVDQPMTAIGKANFLSAEERAQWTFINDTRACYPRNASVFELFAAQAMQDSDRTAVRHDEDSLTYGELLTLAIDVATALHVRGIAHNDRVAIQVRKSPLMIACLLGVLRLGAVYVLIDLALPTARRDFLLKDSGAALLLVDDSATIAPTPVFDVASVGGQVSGAQLPDLAVMLEDSAYVIYTSGTTGWPKGVVVNQRAILRLVCRTDYVDLSPDTIMLQTGAIAFDATTFELWGALLNGGVLVLPTAETLLSAADLSTAIARYGVNTLFLTTALFNQLVEQDASALDGCQVLFGGEVASARHVAVALQTCPRSRFIHVYGPTENTTFSAAQHLTCTYTERVPIGRPIANSTIWVLDRDGNLQPIGVPGELHVGGDGLCVGYLNHPELDEAAFTETVGQTGRLYRTGDIALLNADAQLEFLGRVDDQFKVRGYRVELGEIEYQMARLPRVNTAVVLPRKDADGTTSLCGFFTADGRMDVPAIHADLRGELPDYLVPAFFQQVDELPLTANLKIDRAALVALWPNGDLAADVLGARPLSPVEATVAKIFSGVLNVRVLTADANFFDLGGDSLRTMRLRNRIRTELGLRIDLSSIFEAQTVQGIASIVASVEAPTGSQPGAGGRVPVPGPPE